MTNQNARVSITSHTPDPAGAVGAAAGSGDSLTVFIRARRLEGVKSQTKVLTTARRKALSRVFLNVFQLLLVGMFLSEAFGKLELLWKIVAIVFMVLFIVLGTWLATDKEEEA